MANEPLPEQAVQTLAPAILEIAAWAFSEVAASSSPVTLRFLLFLQADFSQACSLLHFEPSAFSA